jgi:hypothetical protein
VLSGATLNVIGAGSINGASTFEVSGTMNVVDVASSAGAVNVKTGGTLGGNGTVGALTVSNGSTVSPGNGIGTLNVGNTLFEGGGKLKLELSTDGSTGTAGTEWDKLAITGTLNLTSLSSSTPFVLTLSTLSGGSPGPLAGFDSNVDHTWASIITASTIAGFSADKFSFDTSGFSNSFGGMFTVQQNGSSIDLVYLAVPEPNALSMLAGSLGMALGLQRFRRRSRRA